MKSMREGRGDLEMLKKSEAFIGREKLFNLEVRIRAMAL